MILAPYSFNGTTIHTSGSTDYDAYFERSMSNLQIQTRPYYTKRAGAVPIYAGKDYQPATMQVQINLKHDFTELYENVNRLFDTKDETPRLFICIDTENSNKQYYTYATPQQIGREAAGGPEVTVVLALDDPIWQSTTDNTLTWSITGSTSSTSITNNGNDYAYPVFEISPTSAPTTDYAQGFYVQIVPQSAYPWANRFLDITGSTGTTFDTAALVAAGKMQADGDDLRVYRDGVEVDRWLNGINSTDTHVIVTCDMPPQRAMVLKTAVSATDTVTELEFTYTSAAATALNGMPTQGRVIVCTALGATDTEEFTYTSKTLSTQTPYKLAVTVNSRGVRGTTALAHAAGSLVYEVPYDFKIVYGNASSTAPATDDTKKPIQSLTSRNWSFVYSNFFAAGATRPGIWRPYTRSFIDEYLTRSGVYNSTDDAGDTDPATALGLKTQTLYTWGSYQLDHVDLYWWNNFPDGVASVSLSGVQNQDAVVVPASFLAGYNQLTRAWYTMFSSTAQVSTDYGAWTPWSKSSSDMDIQSGTTQLKWTQQGTILGDTDYHSKIEIDAMTIGLTNYPDVRLRNEAASITLNLKISNTTTGEHFVLTTPVLTSESITIDTNPDFPTVKYKGMVINGAIQLSSVRPAWLALNPGANTLTLENNLSAVNDITITITWKDRVNYL